MFKPGDRVMVVGGMSEPFPGTVVEVISPDMIYIQPDHNSTPMSFGEAALELEANYSPKLSNICKNPFTRVKHG